MKKVIICIISIIAIAVIFCIADYSVFTICNKNNTNNKYPFIKHSFDSEKFLASIEFQKPIGLQYKKKPIIVFGDGVAYGYGLDENANLSHYLSERTKRPVYNRAYSGSYIQNALMQIESHSIDNIIKQAEYAIIIVPSKVDNWRLKVYPGPIVSPYDLSLDYNYPKYVGKTAEKLHLDKGKIPFITSSTIYRLLEKIMVEKQSEGSSENLKNLHNHLLKMRNELNKINPDIKLIVLVYYEDLNSVEDLSEENNIILYSIKEKFGDVTQKKYRNEDQNPTSQLWKEAVPVIVKDLKL